MVLLVVLLVMLLVMLALVATARVGVVVDSGMASQLIRSRKLLAAPRELASMRLLACVSADVSRLVLEAVESLVTEGTLVRARKLVCRL